MAPVLAECTIRVSLPVDTRVPENEKKKHDNMKIRLATLTFNGAGNYLKSLSPPPTSELCIGHIGAWSFQRCVA